MTNPRDAHRVASASSASGSVTRAAMCALLSLGAMGGVASSGAQSAAPAVDTSVTHRQRLFTGRDAVVAGVLVAGTVALMPADEWIRGRFTTQGLQSSSTLRGTANDFSLLGDPGTVILSLGTYAVGRIAGNHTVTQVGLHATEALLLSAAATELLKGVVGRHRPYVLPPDQDEYSPMNGFTGAGDTSFPSGHTSAAFAIAAVVAQEGPVHWPHAARFVTPLSYGMATLVGLSRLYKDRHWTSDVVMGALVGEYSGLLVERYNHRNPHNALERWLVPSGIAPTSGGVALVWSVQ